MKAIILIITFLVCACSLIAQKSISLDEIDKHIGDSVQVCGQVNDAYYASRVENTPTFLNIGAKYPNQKLTVIIWKDVRREFERAPEELFKDQKICVIGKLELYKEKPQIVIRKSSQIRVSN